MPENYTVGVSALKRALSEVIAFVGPPTGDPAWLEKAYAKAAELHTDRTFDPEWAFDIDALSNQIGRIAERASAESRQAQTQVNAFERIRQAGDNFESNVADVEVQAELNSLGQDALHPEPVTEEQIEAAIEESTPTALLPAIPERFARPGGGQPASMVRMPVRFAGAGQLPATRKSVWKMVKIGCLSFLAGFLAGMLSRKIFG